MPFVICDDKWLIFYEARAQTETEPEWESEWDWVSEWSWGFGIPILTDDIQADEITAHRLRRYLALVHARVPLLGPLYLERPVLGVLVVSGLETLVRGVRVGAHGQYVNVAVTDPGYLQRDNVNSVKTMANICARTKD